MPKYETEQDRKAERDLLDDLEREWSVSCTSTPTFSRSDCSLTRAGKTVANVEVKCRSERYAHENDQMVDAAKLDALSEEGATTGIPQVLVVRLPTNGDYYYEVDDTWRDDAKVRPVKLAHRPNEAATDKAFIPMCHWKPIDEPPDWL